MALLQLEEKRADYRAKKANEYKHIAENLRTAMRKGGRLDLNKDYAKELGISDPKDKKQLAAARDKAVERADYWENAIRLDDADKAQMDADLGVAPAKPDLALESVTAEQLTAEEKKRKEKAEIKKRKETPLKGGTVNIQPEMDLGQTGQQNLFSPIVEASAPKSPKTEAAEKPQLPHKPPKAKEPVEPAKTAPVSAPQKEATTTPPKSETPAEARKPLTGARGAAAKVFPQGTTEAQINQFVEKQFIPLSEVKSATLGDDGTLTIVGKSKNGSHKEQRIHKDGPSQGGVVEDAKTPAKPAPVQAPVNDGNGKVQAPVSETSSPVINIVPPDNYSFQSSKGRQRWIERMSAAWTKMLEVVKPGETVGLSELYYRTGLPRSDIDDALQLKDPIAGKRWEAFNDFTSFTYTRPAIEPSNKNAPAKPAPVREGQTTEKPVAKPREPSIKMKDAAAEKLARQQEDDLAALFDTPELDAAQLEADSKRFDDELQRQIDGTLPDGHVYQMGRPGAILRSTGVPDLPIQLSAMRLKEKSLYNRHPFELGDVKGLVKALQTPVAVFSYGDKSRAQNIIVEITSNGKNFLVGLSLKPEVGGRVLNVNSIRNVFPKDTVEWLHWIEQGKLLYADKQKVQDLIDQQRMTFADVEYLDLNRVRSILDSFTNPQAENSQLSG